MAKHKKSPIDLSTLELLLSYKYIDNSYKIFWFKGIVTKALEGQQKISMHDLSVEMVLGAWDLVVHKQITFGRLDKLHRTIEEIESLYHVSEDMAEKDLRTLVETIDDKDILSLYEELYEDTPYLFLEPLYEQKLKGKSHSKRKTMIAELTACDPIALYTFDQHNIILNKDWMTYIQRHNKQIEGILRDSLAFFLDKHAMSKR